MFVEEMKNPVPLFLHAFSLKRLSLETTSLKANSVMHCIGQQLEVKSFQTSSGFLSLSFFSLQDDDDDDQDNKDDDNDDHLF